MKTATLSAPRSAAATGSPRQSAGVLGGTPLGVRRGIVCVASQISYRFSGNRTVGVSEISPAGGLIRLRASTSRFAGNLLVQLWKGRWNVGIRSFPAMFDQASSQGTLSKPQAMLSKTRSWKAVAFAVGLGLGTLSGAVNAASPTGGDTVQGLYEALLNTMKNGRTLGQSGRFVQLDPVIRHSFDIPEMARLSLGRSWSGLNEAQRRAVIESYGRYMSAIYADRFDSYAGQKLEVTGEEATQFGVMVRSRIVKANGEPVKVDYVMRRAGAAWLISDIYLDSAISEVATRRSEFATILKNDGIDGLIAALNRKADLLTGTTAKAF
jgi:phospholipid transport system substrate-binding protein